MTRLFISYRRADSTPTTGRIYDRLVPVFGKTTVFRDIDNMRIGKDFRGQINETLNNSDVVLVIIGRNWLTITDKTGQPRLQDPADFVRLEIEAALARDYIPVVPVLVDGATMPAADQLPVSLRELAYKHAVEIRHDPDFHADVNRLIDKIKQISPKSSQIKFRWMVAFVLLVVIGGIMAALILSNRNDENSSTQTPETAIAQQPSDTPNSAQNETAIAAAIQEQTRLAATEKPDASPTPTHTPTDTSEPTISVTPSYTPEQATNTLSVDEIAQATVNAIATEQAERDRDATNTALPLTQAAEATYFIATQQAQGTADAVAVQTRVAELQATQITWTPTPTNTPTATNTPTPTATFTQTFTPSNTATLIPSKTPTVTFTSSNIPTFTPSNTSSVVTRTPTLSATTNDTPEDISSNTAHESLSDNLDSSLTLDWKSPDYEIISTSNANDIVLLHTVLVGEVQSFVLSPQNNFVASVGTSNNPTIYSFPELEVIFSVSNNDPIGYIRYIGFSHDEAILAVSIGSSGSDLDLLDTTTGYMISSSISPAQGYIWDVSFFPDSNIIALAGSIDNRIYLWNIAENSVERQIQGHNENTITVEVSNDGKYLASGGYDNSVRILDLQTNRLILSYNHSKNVNDVAFHPTLPRIASGGDDGSIQIWDFETLVRVVNLRGHTGRVEEIAFSSDGSLLLSAALNNYVKLWNVEDGIELATIGNMTHSIAFSSDGRFIFGVADNSLQIWGVPLR